ncbi:structural maintenance of chromosome protein [Heterostelium album PN500]|uniref:Structural maintenance of chromosomes protein n=1 Tax=Heterostelium pallidum (strain ATCC 26659 / Pp 5 / PN500) TaxID=670386 RepID=D3BHH0_HETP5|nr:structural maintenance of chromosome protein [Heterostelium album PN500]EFA79147.1 structural maintenance of chromosome protein [Heterostelium album PN500]|eukprot:XP_020431269.1 structural maintenance of chromosome protein [Heterostelium album PN500]
MVIVSLEVNNFKSYKGHHVIGTFKQFSCIIGPNGSGKSNLMEAIIFVLGYKSSQIRGTNLTDLIFKPMKEKDTTTSDDNNNNDDLMKDSFVKMNYHHKPTDKHHVFTRKIIIQRQKTVNKDGEESEREVAQSQYFIDDTLLKYEEGNPCEDDIALVAIPSRKDPSAVGEAAGISKITHYIERAEKNHSVQLTTIDQLRTELLELERQESVLDNEEIAKKIDLTREQMEQYSAIKLQAGRDTADLKKQVDSLTRQQNIENASLMTMEAKKEDLEKMKSQLLETSEKMKERLEMSTQVANDTAARLDALKEELKNVTGNNKTLLNRQSQLSSELDRIQFIVSEDKTEKNEKDKDKRMNLIIASLKNLMPDVRGRLSDLVEHTQKKYATAAAVAMGKLNDAIVVDTQKTAYTCVEYMKEQLYGTATFLPLDRLNPKALDPKLRQIGGTSKLLIDCLKFDKVIEPAVRYVVGNTLVCDSLNEAKQLAFGNQYQRHKVVTIQGIKITKTGLMSGGLMGVKSKTKLDESKIEELKKQRDSIQQELAEIASKLVSINDIQVMNNQVNEMTLSVNTNRITMAPLQERINRNTKELDTLNKELAKLAPETDKLKQSIGSRKEQINELTFDINAVEEELFKDLSNELGVKNIKEFEEERLSKIQQASTEKMALSQAISRIKNQLEYESSRNLESEIQSLRADLEANQATLDRQIELQEDCQREVSEFESKSKDLNTKVKSLKSTLVDMNTAIKDIKKKISDNNFKRGQIENQTMVGLNEIRQLKKEYHSHLLEAKTENIRIPMTKLEDEDTEMKDVGEGEEGEGQDKEKEKEGGKKKVEKKKKQEKSFAKKSRKRKSTARETEQEEETDNDLSRVYHDSDDEDFDSDNEDDLEDEADNNFGSLVELPPDVMDPEEDEFYEKHIGIPIDFALVEDIVIKSEERLNYQLKEFSHDLHKIKTSMETYNPNLKAYEHSRVVSKQLKDTIQDLESKREVAKQADQAFAKVRKDRTLLFNRAFDSISKKINQIYAELTRDLYPPYLKGSAQLAVEDTAYPFNAGVKYTAIPPNKRYQEMDQLSGGEKSIAALALLFALHQYRPTPFFVLDEVDAAFDNINVLKLVRYVRSKSTEQKKTQFVVISLKEIFYQNSDGLVGVCREPDSTSNTLTCSLEHLPIKDVELLPIKEQSKVDERVLSIRKQKRQSLLPEFIFTSATETSATESSDHPETDF